MTEPTDTPAAVPRTELPWQLRGARLAEGLFLPVGILPLLAIPLNEAGALIRVGAQMAIAVAAFVGLKRRRMWAWVLAMTLAAFIVTGILVRTPTLVRESAQLGRGAVVSVALVGWAFLTQLAVLLFCLALLPGWRWRSELR